MKKVTAGLFVSLDGVTESPEKWQHPYFNDEMGEAVGAAMAAADAMLLGRVPPIRSSLRTGRESLPGTSRSRTT